MASMESPTNGELPQWTAARGTIEHPAIAGHISNDAGAEAFAFTALLLYAFNIPQYDLWLASLGSCGAQRELLERRSLAWEAMRANNEDATKRHLEWMMLRRRAIEREEYLLPLAQTGKKVRAPHEASNKVRSERAAVEACELQKRAAEKWSEPQHIGKSATEIARLIDPSGWNTTRRKIKPRT